MYRTDRIVYLPPWYSHPTGYLQLLVYVVLLLFMNRFASQNLPENISFDELKIRNRRIARIAGGLVIARNTIMTSIFLGASDAAVSAITNTFVQTGNGSGREFVGGAITGALIGLTASTAAHFSGTSRKPLDLYSNDLLPDLRTPEALSLCSEIETSPTLDLRSHRAQDLLSSE